MIPFRKILFPVDFSAGSVAMVPYVRGMARLCTASVTVLHSFDFLRDYDLAGRLNAGWEFEASPLPYVPWVADLRGQKEERLREFAREQFPDLDCHTIMEDGDPATVIHVVAERDGMDLVMLPTRGAGPFRRLLLGSVTAKVLHDVSCAVFTTAHTLDPTLIHSDGFRAIVCAVELNEEAEAVLRTADSLAKVCGAKLSILHMTRTSQVKPSPNEEELALDALMRRSESGGVARVLHEDVAEGIRHTALEESADLVVVGRGHARGTISRLWSDLYQTVRQSPCPVLSV